MGNQFSLIHMADAKNELKYIQFLIHTTAINTARGVFLPYCSSICLIFFKVTGILLFHTSSGHITYNNRVGVTYGIKKLRVTPIFCSFDVLGV